ncbi:MULTISPECIES: ABC transporter substrate-binding protein [unclassified Arthrobacter]|uniref:ABC transporter substrate-binding protein n=1 Tax=unclassified Arthrobacter TaxID=235627 RepID=UPI00159DF7A4|nr:MULTISPECIES: ABC transporter substrate-binding protein [unclassified Arthrobacter]MCQ9165179.1 ABC transporter substrate-binding protein [Arthrobacter sp. STN4]NVM98087.1 ABC transporter substrate-binding protein [Arthrobacter sp. SDTb3-6]
MSRAPSITRRTAIALAGLCVVLPIAGCGVGMGSAKVLGAGDPIKVGVIPVADFAPVYIAQEEGYFKDEGLNVQTQVMQNAAAIAPSVINGQLQFGTAAITPFLAAVQKGLPLKAVANGSSIAANPALDPSALVVAKGSTIKGPRDLEGHTVAVNALGSIVHVVAAAAIKKDGGDPSKVTFVAMPFPDMIPALHRGAIDAASLVEPFQVKAVATGARVIAHPYSASLTPDGTFTVIFTAGPFAEKNPETVKKFQRAMDRASLLAASHPEKVGQVLAKYGKLPPEVFAKMRVPMYTDKMSIPAIENTAKLMQELGFLPGPVDVKGAVWP